MINRQELKRIVIEVEDTPGILYKYSPWDKDCKKNDKTEYYKKLISIPQIYLSSIEAFNDPFDCGIRPRFDLWSEDNFRTAWDQLLRNKNKSSEMDELETKLDSLIQMYRSNPGGVVADIDRKSNDIFKKNIGILCLSEIKDNMLMWSHYSDNHRGICIGYNAYELEKCIMEHLPPPQNSSKWVHYLKVRYKKHYPIIRPNTDMKDHRDFIDRLRTKYRDWKYEKEWRLSVGLFPQEGVLENHHRIVNLPIDAIKEIYLGMHMSEANVTEIITILRNSKYRGHLFRMKKRNIAIN